MYQALNSGVVAILALGESKENRNKHVEYVKISITQGTSKRLDSCQDIDIVFYLATKNWITFDLGTTSLGRLLLS